MNHSAHAEPQRRGRFKGRTVHRAHRARRSMTHVGARTMQRTRKGTEWYDRTQMQWVDGGCSTGETRKMRFPGLGFITLKLLR